jgi:hypothetical protein
VLRGCYCARSYVSEIVEEIRDARICPNGDGVARMVDGVVGTVRRIPGSSCPLPRDDSPEWSILAVHCIGGVPFD